MESSGQVIDKNRKPLLSMMQRLHQGFVGTLWRSDSERPRPIAEATRLAEQIMNSSFDIFFFPRCSFVLHSIDGDGRGGEMKGTGERRGVRRTWLRWEDESVAVCQACA